MWCCVFTVFLSFSPFIYLFIYLYCHFTAFMGSSFYLLFLLCCQSTLSTLFLKSTISIKFIIVIIYSGWRAAVCQRSAVLLWLQLWGQTPLISENWIWVQQPAGLSSEGAVWFSTESNLSTGDSEVRHHVLLLKVQCVEFSDIWWWSVILQLNTTPPPPPPPFQTWKRTCGSFSCHRNSKGLVCPVWATVKNMAASVERTCSWCKYKEC